MKRFLLCIALIALLPGLSSRGFAASGNKKAAVTTKAPAQNPADFVGSDVCATCHAEVAKKFSSNPHSKLALLHNGTGATCESCHGGGKAHVEGGGDVTKIKQLAKLTPAQASETCLGCHAGAHPNFERSPHGKAGVGCTSCHSVHSGDTEAKLLKTSQPKLCFQCHADVKPSFDMPFHHRVNEGLMKCSDCHDAHGTFTANNVRSTADMNQVCTKCHAETRGPFVFEHAAVKGEGCMGCHTPHGSQNARLLNVSNINQLCAQCHSPVSGDTIHGMSAGSPDRPVCITCHTMIHGSNVNPAFIR
jgi:DmsE family decaheme c-type cytochrome